MNPSIGTRRSKNIHLGNLVSYAQISQGLHILAENAWIRIEFWNPGVVRVRAGRMGESLDDFSYALDPNATRIPVSVELVAAPESIVLSGGDVQVRILTQPVSIQFLDETGRIVNSDDPAFGISWLGQEVSVYKTLQPGERFLGLGEKTGPLDKRGRAYVNNNTDHFGYGPDSDPLYASIPFFIGVHAQGIYGFFLNNSYKSTFNFGASSDRFAWYAVDDGQMDYFYLHGGLEGGVEHVLKSYTALTGAMPLPPKWALGFQQCRYSYYPDAELLRIAQTFREKHIPCDVLYLDIHYMDAFKVFSWHPEYFPNPKSLADQLKALGIRLVIIMDPGIKVEEGYAAYDSGMAEGHFALLPDGKPYRGQVWPGWSHFPDFTASKTREWWGAQMKIYSEAGIEGFWNDMNEPAAWGQHLPGLIEFDMEGEGSSFKEARNVYGMQMARATMEGASKLLGDKRPFNLTRAGFAGIQRYAAVWTGDNTASEEHMLAGVRLVNSLGLSGVAFAGYDIGGFVGESSPALYARWMQLGAFSPFFRAHSMINSRDSEPWSFGEEVEDIARNFIRLRYRLMPYLYAAFEGATSGLPIARSLALEWPQDPKIYQQPYDNAYLFGSEILVIPVESHKQLAKVYLPQGQWYDFYDDVAYDGGREVLLELNIEKLPLFVRSGAVIAMQSPVTHTGEAHDGTLQLHVYSGTQSRSFELFQDDGLANTASHRSEFARNRGFHDGASRILQIEGKEGTYPGEFQRIKLYLHGLTYEPTVLFNGTDINVQFDEFRLVEPVSRFDPFMPPVGNSPKVERLPCCTFSWDMENAIEIRY
ncbi:MAG: DUF4968 domain-containing protein [Bacteroidetes bacterium]|nr:DUF4968 domain-containing protein [Bacteroidota bacterium]